MSHPRGVSWCGGRNASKFNLSDKFSHSLPAAQFLYPHVRSSNITFINFIMASIPHVLQNAMTAILVLAGFIVLFLMYYKSVPSPECAPRPAHPGRLEKPVLLLWFWPEDQKFDFEDCKTLFKIDSCHLTDDRSLYSRARAVVMFHRAIEDDLSNLPTSPRSKFQRWIWFNMDSPLHTRRIEGIQSFFNLTMTYRKDSDIHIRWKMRIKNNTDADFVLPNKERLVCWIVDGTDLQNKSGDKYDYYKELLKHIKVEVFDSSSDQFSKGENYFQTISTCKFYLSFEDSNHTDYITENFNAPLAAGTVPVVLGPPRRNYEDFAPGSSFIHVKDFPDAEKLAEHLQKLNEDNEAYKRYFDWRQFYTARHHLREKHKFAHAICQACHYVSMYREYRVVPDVYKWFFI